MKGKSAPKKAAKKSKKNMPDKESKEMMQKEMMVGKAGKGKSKMIPGMGY